MILGVGLYLIVVGWILLITRRSFLGILMGELLLVMGSVGALAAGGLLSGAVSEGYEIGILVLIIGMAQILLGFGMAIRTYYLKKAVAVEQLYGSRG